MKSGIHYHYCPKCKQHRCCPQITHCQKPDENICPDCASPDGPFRRSLDEGDDRPKKYCMFCYQLYTPPTVPRMPSHACDRCWLEIRAGMLADYSGLL